MNMFVKFMVLLVTLLLTGCGLWLGLSWLLPAYDIAASRPFFPFLAGCLVVVALLLLWRRLVTTLGNELPVVPAKERQWRELPMARADRGGLPMVRLAHFHYHLDDPRDPQSFAIFLNEPIFLLEVELELGRDDTPLQVIEDALVNYGQQVEHVHGNRLLVDVTLRRGSLTIGLTILAAYEFLAQYHDFIESIQLLRRQIGHLLNEVSHWYHSLTGGKLDVQSNITIDAPTINPHKGVEPSTSRAAQETPSITIHNTIAPPAGPPGIPGWSPVWATFWGCLIVWPMLILVLLMTLLMICQVLSTPENCAWTWRALFDLLHIARVAA
jgi:hypothetical protein